jgi:hypothetical protein
MGLTRRMMNKIIPRGIARCDRGAWSSGIAVDCYLHVGCSDGPGLLAGAREF